MTTETKTYIEQNISSIEKDGLVSAYLNCPLHILNDFNNTMHCAGINYPLEINVYVVLCCYISKRCRNARLDSYDFDYNTDTEEYEFTCDGFPYPVKVLNHELSVRLPTKFINTDITQQWDYKGKSKVKIRVRIH